jgi:hypothetical protein
MGKAAELVRYLCGLLRVGIPVSRGSGNAGNMYFRHSTRSVGTSPLGGTWLTGGGTVYGEHRIQRYIVDSDRHLFGYDLSVGTAGGAGERRVVFEPLSLKPDQLVPTNVSREQLPVDRLPPPQALRFGQAFEFRLSTADGRYKVVERIEFMKPPGRRVHDLGL